jgi:glutamate racemase
MSKSIPVGIFDSGYGGLTILEKIQERLPQYDYLYLGDNARTPYGTRSFEVVYQFTRQSVQYLFNAGCPLVILACNTASAKALRTIQQRDLPATEDPTRRVLGIIRPTAEAVDSLSRTKHIGIFGTPGTIVSRSYTLEIAKLFPHVTLVSEACPMWVPLVENNEHLSPGADYFVKQHVERLLAQDARIDTILLGCTHYPLLADKIRQFLPPGITVFPQGSQVAERLQDYLLRHPEMDRRLSKGRSCRFLTTESVAKFSETASFFLKKPLAKVKQVVIG